MIGFRWILFVVATVGTCLQAPSCFAGQDPLPEIFSQATLPDSTRSKRTTRMAAFIPGAGQIMNRKYWKAPLVWGGIAWCISLIDYNTSALKQARAELILLEQTQANAYDLLQARNEETFYRQQRDVSWFALTGVHLLSILDAHVDANLLAFDVSEDLSMEFAPLIPAGQGPQAAALGIVLSWELNCSKHPKFTR